MAFPIEALISILDLEQLEVNLFRGQSPQNSWQRIFGGQVIGQALVAAERTVEDRLCHSLHAYFLLAGDPKVPIIFEVERIRDGGSFTTRRVKAIQHGQAIFAMTASFQKEEPGLDHQIEMPDVPDPESLPSEAEVKARLSPNVSDAVRIWLARERPIELRPVDFSRYVSPEPRPPVQNVWFRANGALPADDARLHRCVLAYASDFGLLGTTLVAHGRMMFDPQIMMASLDHGLWIHRDFRADEWLLYAMDSPSTQGARGLSRGSIFSRDGKLVASVAQEGLIRIRTPKS